MRVHSTHPPYLIELSATELAEIEVALEEHRRVSWLRAKELTDALGPSLHVPGPEVFVCEIDDVLEQIELLDPSSAAGWVDDDLSAEDRFDDLLCDLCGDGALCADGRRRDDERLRGDGWLPEDPEREPWD